MGGCTHQIQVLEYMQRDVPFQKETLIQTNLGSIGSNLSTSNNCGTITMGDNGRWRYCDEKRIVQIQ